MADDERDGREAGVTTRRRLLAALVALLVIAGVTGAVVLASGPDVPTAAPPPAPAVPAPPPAVPAPPPVPPCSVPPGARQRDVDTGDSPDAPWPRVPGRRLVVHFTTEGLPLRYANAVRLGAQLWSRGTCVDAVAVPRCPPRSNCTTVAARRGGGGRDVDGDSESRERRGVKVGNAITLYTGLLDASSDIGALGTVVHEMGHALGLRHRHDPRSIMNATTGDRTDPRPDAVDLANLAALYADREASARPR